MTIDEPAEAPAESESAPPPLTPEARARPTLRGEIEVEVFGHRWTLADYMPGGHPVWDEIFDLGNLAGKYPPDRLRLAAFHLLWANYDLTADEGAAIILGVPSPELVEAVQVALYGSAGEQYSSARTYSQWIRYCLWSVGLDEERVAPWDRRPFATFLAICGAVPSPEFWIGSVATVARNAANH
jgi:hypothetical protein